MLRTGPVAVTCAGRTDAGVHARGQVAHVDVPAAPAEDLARRLNRALPDDLVVRSAVAAPAGFDARFSALWRRYVYRVCDDPSALDPLRRGEVLVWRRPVDEQRMGAAAEGLLGEHDFAAYCRAREGATTIRTLRRLSPARAADGLLETTVVADAFCHHMVRALMGALLAVGEGRLAVEEPARVLATRARDSRLPVVPAHGLTLEQVGYPPDEDMAARAGQARARRSDDL